MELEKQEAGGVKMANCARPSVFATRLVPAAVRGVALGLLLALTAGAAQLRAQSNADPVEEKRQVKSMVQPTVPDLARRMNLKGTVKIEVTIAPNGTVKSSKILGGHPLLAVEAQHAAEKSTFLPGPRETIEVIEFKF